MRYRRMGDSWRAGGSDGTASISKRSTPCDAIAPSIKEDAGSRTVSYLPHCERNPRFTPTEQLERTPWQA